MADYEINLTAESWFRMTTDWTGHFGNIGVAEVLDELFATVVGLREKGMPGVTHDQIVSDSVLVSHTYDKLGACTRVVLPSVRSVPVHDQSGQGLCHG
eukprot:8743150-Heterocapsa_arctica.AAC.1